MGLAAAAARCLVGGAGGGLPLAAGHENNGSAGCAEQRTGRAVLLGVESAAARAFCLCFTVIYAVAVIVAVTDQKNTRPGAEHGSAAWGDVFRLNKFYMDRRGSNLLLTQHSTSGSMATKHKHNTNILIVGGSGAGKDPHLRCAMCWNVPALWSLRIPKAEILRKTGNLLESKRAMRLSFSTS